MEILLLHVVLGLLVNDKAQILVAERPLDKPMAGLWELPGGKIESLETPLQALKRELREEIGVEIDLNHATFLGHIEHLYPEFLFNAAIYICNYWKGIPSPLENQKLAWIELSNIENYDFLPTCKKIFSLLELKTDLKDFQKGLSTNIL